MRRAHAIRGRRRVTGREGKAVDPVLTTCPFCPCGCGFYLLAREGRTEGVIPSASDPVSRGRLCARGWASHEAPAWGERLTEPLLRHDGRMRPVSWETALDAAAGSLAAMRRAGRTIGVLGSARATNEENYLAVRMARGALQTPHVGTCLSPAYQPLLDGLHDVTERHAGSGGVADLEGCDVIVLVEGDVAVTHPQVAGAIVRARKAGCRLVTIGAVASQMTRLATLAIAAPPGRERAVTFELAAAALATGRLDTATIVAAGETFDELRRSLAGVEVSKAVARAAGWYAQAQRAGIVVAPLVGDATDLRRLAGDVATLAAATGHLDRDGSPLLMLPARGNLRGACEVGASSAFLPGFAPLSDEKAASRLEGVWGVPPARETGLDATAMLSAARGAVIVAEDPSVVLPAGALAREALEGMECVVLLDAFATAALELATVVLPIASFAENDGTVTGLDGRLRRVRAAGAPPGMARPGWAVLGAMLGRLGPAAEYESAEGVRREIARAVPPDAAPRWRELDQVGVAPKGERNGLRRRSLGPLTPCEPVEPAPLVAVWDGVFDWGRDPLVRYSPTLCRESVAQRKLFPGGFVELSREAMERLGVRQGWPVRLKSAGGEAVAPALMRADLAAGVVVVPFALRDGLAPAMGGRGVAGVAVERA